MLDNVTFGGLGSRINGFRFVDFLMDVLVPEKKQFVKFSLLLSVTNFCLIKILRARRESK